MMLVLVMSHFMQDYAVNKRLWHDNQAWHQCDVVIYTATPHGVASELLDKHPIAKQIVLSFQFTKSVGKDKLGSLRDFITDGLS